MVKNILRILLGCLLISAVAFGGWYAFIQQGATPSTVIDPTTLPANGVHVSVSPIEGVDNRVRVEIIANIPQAVAGFDLSVDYDATQIAPINTADDLPATVGSLFTGATLARNEVVSDETQTYIRIMYVFFGQSDQAQGAGTLAIMDFELQPGVDEATISLSDARLSRINAQGDAEYVSLVVSDPTIALIQGAEGSLQIQVGALPTGTLDLMTVAIMAIIVGAVGALGMFGWWMTGIARNPRRGSAV